MYITKYGCVFLKLGESIYAAMDLIPILLGSLPLAHNAQHSLVIIIIMSLLEFYSATHTSTLSNRVPQAPHPPTTTILSGDGLANKHQYLQLDIEPVFTHSPSTSW